MFALKRFAARSSTFNVRNRLTQQLQAKRGAGGGMDMPVPQSMSAKLFEGHPTNEGWETTVAWWYTSSFIILVAIAAYQPETGIGAWAEQEARARLKLKSEGFTDFEFGKHYQGMSDEDMKAAWDNFTAKAVRMTDDDDDDEEEDDEDEDDDDEDDE
jgi:ESSS subunit of NADH:ubiquinone oxidoreductase (complex I)